MGFPVYNWCKFIHISVCFQINYKGPPIRKLACGAEHSLMSDIRGNLYSFGCPEYGVLGEYIQEYRLAMLEIKEIFECKVMNIFFFISFNICFRFSKKPVSIEYPQHMF